MSWNYRVIRRYGVDNAKQPWESFQVHEVYYDKNGKMTSVSIDAVAACGETVEELKADFELMLGAFKKPVVEYEAIPEEGALSLGYIDNELNSVSGEGN